MCRMHANALSPLFPAPLPLLRGAKVVHRDLGVLAAHVGPVLWHSVSSRGSSLPTAPLARGRRRVGVECAEPLGPEAQAVTPSGA